MVGTRSDSRSFASIPRCRFARIFIPEHFAVRCDFASPELLCTRGLLIPKGWRSFAHDGSVAATPWRKGSSSSVFIDWRNVAHGAEPSRLARILLLIAFGFW